MESSPRENHGILFGVLLLLLAGLLSGGCGSSSPVGPDGSALSDSTDAPYTRTNPPPFLTTSRRPGLLSPAGLTLPDLRPWYTLVTRWVAPGAAQVVSGGRYELRFDAGSLREGTQVVVKEWDSGVLEFELGPHGATFEVPVDLYVDFAGTNADSSSANFDGSAPELYWFNQERGEWEVVPGKVEGRKYHAQLPHFSSYGLARGKGGW